jgi:hypothetical protein
MVGTLRFAHPTLLTAGSRMKIPTLPFTVTDWSQVARRNTAGETGEALWRTLNIGDLRVRMVEYSPGLPRRPLVRPAGHVLYVLEGELDSELRDGRTFKLKAGMSYQVSDFGDAAHRLVDEDRREAVHRRLSVRPAAGSPRPPPRHRPCRCDNPRDDLAARPAILYP